jgi:hypothetical protein
MPRSRALESGQGVWGGFSCGNGGAHPSSRSDLCAGSVSLAEITGVIERETGTRLSIDRLQEISTVGDIQDLLDSSSLENETSA